MKHACYILVISILTFAGCAVNSLPPPSQEPTVSPPSNYISERTHSVDGRLFIGPQPASNDLVNLKAEGIQRVVSFRRPEEMAKLDFREAARLSELGIDYFEIPVGGRKYPYSPVQLEALSDVLQQDGKVLLHCGSGYRASIITVAYLIEGQGMLINEAITHAEGWWPLELEDVLGEKLSLNRQPK